MVKSGSWVIIRSSFGIAKKRLLKKISLIYCLVIEVSVLIIYNNIFLKFEYYFYCKWKLFKDVSLRIIFI